MTVNILSGTHTSGIAFYDRLLQFMGMWRSSCFASFEASCLKYLLHWIRSTSTTAENYNQILFTFGKLLIHFSSSLHLLLCPTALVSFPSKQFHISYHTSLAFSETHYETHYNASITWSSSNFERCFQMVAYSNFKISFLIDNSLRSPNPVYVAFIYCSFTIQILSRCPIM